VIVLALTFYIISGTFVWFFIGDLLFKVSPFDAIMILGLVLINKLSQRLILSKGEKK